MKNKQAAKILIDSLMLCLLLGLMAFHFTGQQLHEWFGVMMFVFCIAHQVLNRHWYKNLLRGKYSSMRILQSAVNFLLLLALTGLMVSGIFMSNYVFSFLPISGGQSIARQMHLLSSYWIFVLTAFHLGLHWHRILSMLQKVLFKSASIINTKWLTRTVAFSLSGYGVYAFAKHNIGSYLLMQVEFAFFDFQQPRWMFFFEYTAMIALCVCIAYYTSKIMKYRHDKKGCTHVDRREG